MESRLRTRGHATEVESKGCEIVLMKSEGIIVSAGLQRLRESPYGAVRRLSCEFAGGVLTLRGNVASFFHKQIAQQSVAGLEGVAQVDNQIEVR
jgi:osmotically-inducible protein OsmY